LCSGYKWVLEPSLEYEREQTGLGTDLSRWTPDMRLSRPIRKSLTFELEYISEHATTTSPGTQNISKTHPSRWVIDGISDTDSQ
jgi:hypothetical protein